MADWREELSRWLAPFLAKLGHKARRRMCPLYVAGLIGPGDRKSVGLNLLHNFARRHILIDRQFVDFESVKTYDVAMHSAGRRARAAVSASPIVVQTFQSSNRRAL